MKAAERIARIDARETRSSTDFAVTIGGGADVRLGDRISVRVFDGDYSRIFLPRGNGFGFAPRPHNVRLSFGVVMNKSETRKGDSHTFPDAEL